MKVNSMEENRKGEYPQNRCLDQPGPSGKCRYEALALKYCLVIFHDSTQRQTNPQQHGERLEYYDRVH